MADESASSFTNGGNRRKAGYEQVVSWMNTSCKAIKPHTIQRSFQTTGLYHKSFNMNHLTFSNQLNHRLKKLFAHSWNE